MALNFGQIKARVMSLLDEAGVTPTSATLTKIQDFTNDTQMDLASTVAKIPAVSYIALNPVRNDSSYDTSKLKQHLPDEDFSVELTGAKSYFFEASGPATVKVEEYVNGAWVDLPTPLTVSIAASVTSLTEYKGLITAADAANNIRLRFTGNYVYNFRNYILYPYTWSDANSIQQHRPNFEYSLPSDFLSLSHVMAKRGYGEYVPFTDYSIRPDKKVVINRYYAPAEFALHYHKKPTALTFAGTGADDNLTFEVNDDAVQIMPLGIAGRILVSEDEEGKGVILLNDYEGRKVNLSKAPIYVNNSVTRLYGW